MIGRSLAITLWRVFALVNVALALLGTVLPVLPTVPFLIVAAWAGSRGWPRLETWLIEHPRHGPAIRRWRDDGAVPRRAKWLASTMMVISALTLAMMSVPLWTKLAAPSMMAIVAIWLWTRPDA
ncbi:MAG: YbaN family protein [Burkholderiaceae bacterium]|nr:YbaN family protein [Burkholderiaceae bacterium]